MTTFATRDEAEGALRYVRALLERLPVAGDPALHRILGGIDALEGLLRSTTLTEPADAAGTTAYRRNHNLPLLEENEDA